MPQIGHILAEETLGYVTSPEQSNIDFRLLVDGSQNVLVDFQKKASELRTVNAQMAANEAEVGNGPALLRMSALFRNDPVYRRFYQLWQDMNLGLAALFGYLNERFLRLQATIGLMLLALVMTAALVTLKVLGLNYKPQVICLN